jgi:endonuclease/exonuclease/phosphatase family metal-dependent hydrolase
VKAPSLRKSVVFLALGLSSFGCELLVRSDAPAAPGLEQLGDEKDDQISEVELVAGDPARSATSSNYDSFDPSQLRIMTFNVQWLIASVDEVQRLEKKGITGLAYKLDEDSLRREYEKLAEIIKAKSPDVVCLQEVINQPAIDRLVAELEKIDVYYEAHFLNSRSTFLEQDVVFMTKRNPDKTSDEQIYRPASPSKSVVLNLEFQGRKFAFLGLHLLARPTDKTRVGRRETQARQVAETLQKIQAEGRVSIVLGDFNDWDRETPDSDTGSSPVSQVFEIIKNFDAETESQELFNAAEHIAQLGERYTHIYRGHKTMLDHILISESERDHVQAVFIDHTVPTMVSDHDPVIVDLDYR